MMFTPSIVAIRVDPAPALDAAAERAEAIMARDRGSFSDLFEEYEESWVTPDHLRQFATALGGLEVFFDQSNAIIAFSPWASLNAYRDLERLLFSIPTQHAIAFRGIINEVMTDYIPEAWLRQYTEGEYLRPANDQTAAVINAQLARFERELIAYRTRRPSEQLAWRLGVPFGWR